MVGIVTRMVLLLATLLSSSCVVREQWQYATLYSEARTNAERIEWLESLREAYPGKIRARIRFRDTWLGWHDEAWVHFKLAKLYFEERDFAATERNLLAAKRCLDDGAEQNDPDTSRDCGDFVFLDRMIDLAQTKGDGRMWLAYLAKAIDEWEKQPEAYHHFQKRKHDALRALGRYAEAADQAALVQETRAAAQRHADAMAPARAREAEARRERRREMEAAQAHEDEDREDALEAMIAQRAGQAPERNEFLVGLTQGLQQVNEQLSKQAKEGAIRSRAAQPDLQRASRAETRAEDDEPEAERTVESPEARPRPTGQAPALQRTRSNETSGTRSEGPSNGPRVVRFADNRSAAGAFPKGVTSTSGTFALTNASITALELKYDFSVFFGEPTAACVIKWEGSSSAGDNLPTIRARLAITASDSETLYYTSSPGTTKAGKGYGFDVAGSPNWGRFLENSNGAHVDEATAKAFLKKATAVRIVEMSAR